MNLLDTIKQPVARSTDFFNECWSELKKVHWPTRPETQAATVAVLLGVVIVGAYLGIVDFALTRGLQWMLGSND